MPSILVELFALVLCHKYGALTGPKCKDILRLQDIQAFLDEGFDRRGLSDGGAVGTELLKPSFQFLRWVLNECYVENNTAIKVSSRPKSYFTLSENLAKIRAKIVVANEAVARLHTLSWALPGTPFFQCLPDV